MAFCSNCGHHLRDGVKFCSNCGSPVIGEDRTKRQQEYAGKVNKCPSCGAELPSFTALCPSCGHEIYSAKVSSTIREFSNQISRCDMEIANSFVKPKRGWMSWSIGIKIGWIFLNAFTFCLPLLIYLIIPLIGSVEASALTIEEQKKATVINNFVFPNERESILEGLLYIKSQTRALVSGSIDQYASRWVKIWKNKASQLFERAELMFKGDSIANDAYSSIIECERKVKTAYLVRIAVVSLILLAFIARFVAIRISDYKLSKEELNSTFEWPTSGLSQLLPEPPTNKGKISINNDEDFFLSIREIDPSQYELYLNDCEEYGFTIESKRSSISYEAFSEDGYHLDLIYDSRSTELAIRLSAPMPMGEIQWPKSDIAKRLPTPPSSYGCIEWETSSVFRIYLGNFSKQDYSKYIDSCIKAGFSVDYRREEDHFYASDKKGYTVTIDYKGNSIVYISIRDP